MAGISSTLLTTFLENLDKLVEPAADARAIVRMVRDNLTRALKEPGFRLACIERLLDTLEPGYAGWRYPKIHRNPARDYSVCVFNWPPGLSNAPHRHDTWTVTGILHNSLRFTTFRFEPGKAALIPEKQIEARPGEVGYICTPCIHNVQNLSAAPSLSIHIFTHPKIAGVAADVVEYEMEGTVPQPTRPTGAGLDGRVREDVLASCAAMIGAHAHPRSLPLLDRIADLAQGRARLSAVKAMSRLDPLHAAHRAQAVAEQMDGRLRDQLRRVSEAILQND